MVADFVSVSSFLFSSCAVVIFIKACGENAEHTAMRGQFVGESRCIAIKFWVSSRAPSDLAISKSRLRLLFSEQNRGVHASHRDLSVSRPS